MNNTPELKRLCGLVKAVTLDDTSPGSLEGYANVIGVVDSYGERTMPGAFAQDVQEFISKGYLAVDHEWEVKDGAIGYIVEAKEDTTGLWFRAEFHTDQKSQDIRRKVAERLAAGKEVGLSIGYWTMEAESVTTDMETVRELRRVLVKEVSVVFAQANQPSVVTSAKSVTREDEYTALASAVDGYASRIKEINDLGRPDTWKQDRVEELNALVIKLSEAADSLTPAEKPAQDDDGDALAALALAGATLGR